MNKTKSIITGSVLSVSVIAVVFAFGFGDIPPTIAVQENTLPLIQESQPNKVGIDGVQASGWVKITVLDEFGNVKQVHEDHNLIHTVGLGATSDHLFGTTHVTGEGVFNWIGVGTSSAALNAAHTDCQTPTGSRQQDASVTNSGNNGAVINTSWAATLGSVTIEEICLFDAASTGNMYARQLTGSIVVGASDTVNADWTITFADSNAS